MTDSYRIVFTKRVTADLDAIFKHIAQDSPHNAAAFVARILDAIDRLKQFPHRTIAETRNRKSARPVRTLPVQSYIVFFRVDDRKHVVDVVHVRHGARRRPRGFD